MQSRPFKASIRKNDQVQVMAGKEKGKIGKVLKVHATTGAVTIEKINLVKRHTRPTQQKAGGIVEKELPLHYSNVLLFCAKCNRGVRHGISWTEGKEASKATHPEGTQKRTKTKVRVCKRCESVINPA